jgi:hypothetical protein
MWKGVGTLESERVARGGAPLMRGPHNKCQKLKGVANERRGREF